MVMVMVMVMVIITSSTEHKTGLSRRKTSVGSLRNQRVRFRVINLQCDYDGGGFDGVDDEDSDDDQTSSAEAKQPAS